MSHDPSRRAFLKTSAALAGTLAAAPLVHAGGDDLLRVGLIGCGGGGARAPPPAPQPRQKSRRTGPAGALSERLPDHPAPPQKEPQGARKGECEKRKSLAG